LAAIERAISIDPQQITLSGTRGSLLIEKNEIETGERILKEVQANSLSEMDQAICAYYLALAQKKKGNGEEALRQFRAAQARYPQCIVAPRIEGMIFAPDQDGPLERKDAMLATPEA
jgi:predicted Zn-dependent protease